MDNEVHIIIGIIYENNQGIVNNDNAIAYLREQIPKIKKKKINDPTKIAEELLKDSEEKTRANAAGALGNFVRNSNTLCKDLIKLGALK
jgi:hypothetical protein